MISSPSTPRNDAKRKRSGWRETKFAAALGQSQLFRTEFSFHAPVESLSLESRFGVDILGSTEGSVIPGGIATGPPSKTSAKRGTGEEKGSGNQCRDSN